MSTQYQLWDFPGDFSVKDTIEYGGNVLTEDSIFKHCGALVFVMDAQDEPYNEALAMFHQTVVRAHEINPNIICEVFIHKVDGDLFLSDEHKVDCQRDIQQQITDELQADANGNIPITFHLTSIYDHSIFEACSKVVQKLIPQMSTMQNMLDLLTFNCKFEKTFLFDVVSKIYIATDSNPVDMQSYELCSDMIDVVVDVSCIYGFTDEHSDILAYDDQVGRRRRGRRRRGGRREEEKWQSLM
jgi:Ras-related GTP-binding protein C/D